MLIVRQQADLSKQHPFMLKLKDGILEVYATSTCLFAPK